MKNSYTQVKELIKELPENIDVISKSETVQAQKKLENFEDTLLDMSFEEQCSFFYDCDKNIKKLIKDRQALVSPWKACVKDVEQKFLPIVKGLEALKDSCHKHISNEIFSNPDLYSRDGVVAYKQDKLAIKETKPKREFSIENLRAIPKEFLKLDEDAIEAYMEIFGTAPEGVEVKETKQCMIICKN